MILNLINAEQLIYTQYAERIEGVPGIWLTDKGKAFVRGLQLRMQRVA